MSVLEISRVDRENQTYDLAALFPKLSGFTVASVALLPPRTGPSAATVWTSLTVASNSATVLFAGPDADSTGAVVVTGNCDVWMKTTVGSQTDAAKAGTIRLQGGGTVTAPGPLPQVLSVQGRTGAVVLSASDVGADAAGAATTAQAAAIAAIPSMSTIAADPALRAAFGASGDPLAKLTKNPVVSKAKVSIATPAAGQSVTVETFTGAGIVRNIWMTIESGSLVQDAVLQVFVDGAATPSIEADFGTLFLTALDAHTGSGGSYATEHMLSAAVGSTRSGAMSGGILFPIPYSNGCVIKVYAPPGATNPGGQLFTQIINQPGATSTLRLRSQAVTQLNKISATNTTQITLADVPNAKGHLVWIGFAATGAANYSYLERQWYVAVDQESLNLSAQGAAYPSFATSGGEDLFLNGWYFGFKGTVTNPWTIVTANNNAAKTCVAGFDLLAAYGGVPFTSRLRVGWSLKDGGTLGTVDVGSHTMSYVVLYYVDTATPFAPSAPQSVAAASASATSAAITWARPASPGSSPVTGYTITASPSGVTATAAAGATGVTLTGLPTGVQQTISVTATNGVGTSAAGTTTVTAIAVAVVSDAFTRANSTTSLGTADTGQAWTAAVGTWGIASNTAYLPTPASNVSSFAVIDSGMTDGTISVKITGATDAGLTFRYVDAANNFGMNLTGLAKRVANAYTPLGTFSTPFASGDVCAIVLSGSSITVKRNGATVLTLTDTSNATATKHGLTAYQDSGVRFDDFSIYP